MVVASIFAVFKGDFHPLELGLTAGITVGMMATYVFLYVYAVRPAKNSAAQRSQ